MAADAVGGDFPRLDDRFEQLLDGPTDVLDVFVLEVDTEELETIAAKLLPPFEFRVPETDDDATEAV